MESPDPEAFKSRDAASYDLVTEQFDHFTERLTRPLALRLLELAEIAPNEKILDIGTGTGVVALQAAQTLGSDGIVYGIDLSEAMLAKADEKGRHLGVDRQVKFTQMDAEALNFEDEQFDAVVSLFALLHFPNPLTALKEFHRVLRPGGRAVIGVGSGMPIFSLSGWAHLVRRVPDFYRVFRGKQLVAPQFLDSLVRRNTPETGEPEESSLASHSRNRTRMVALLARQAGLDVLKTSWRGHQELIETPEEFWEIQSTFSSIARKRLSALTTEEVESLRRGFLEKCRSVQSRGGHLVYPFAAFYVVARRPEVI